MLYTMDELVAAVRADEEVGVGSCSVIDECWTDEELVDWFRRWNITTPEQAVADARETHRVWDERRREIQAEIF